MRGLWIEDGTLRFRDDLPEPAAFEGEVRVQVLRAGVCATDLALERGYMGFRGIPGHEFLGRALEGPLDGQRVVGEINAACGTCARCRSGEERHCPTRSVLGILARDGAFADVLRLPAGNLLPVPDEVADEAAVFVEPLAAAFEIAEQLDLRTFERALVIGDGRLGLLCAQVLADAGVETVLMGRHPERGDWLPDTIRHAGEPPEALAPEDRFALVVEATGDPRVLARALAFVQPRGTLVLKTTSEATASLDLAPLVVDEVTLVGSRCGRFAPALQALSEERVVVEPMLHGSYPLEDGVRAFAEARRPGKLKIQLEVSA